MAALAHLGVGLTAKPIAPEISVGWLVFGAYTLDSVWAAFRIAGVDQAVWSHSLVMAVIWSGLAGLVAGSIGGRTRTGVVFGTLYSATGR